MLKYFFVNVFYNLFYNISIQYFNNLSNLKSLFQVIKFVFCFLSCAKDNVHCILMFFENNTGLRDCNFSPSIYTYILNEIESVS